MLVDKMRFESKKDRRSLNASIIVAIEKYLETKD